ncbi:MAG: UDP-glucose/GDP-mannose dehydrogenase family protein [Candidatus Peribacteraceae bacterium]|nr:UDP-glucose/GDP-mannose dehydrogenase family protein [Candidatus Peribacteraceae bacterium]
MRIAIVGTGYVGLVSAACFAELGHEVIGVDIDQEKVKMLKKGISPIYEPGLEELIRSNLKSKRLSFTTDLTEVLPHVQVLFSAVATPPGEGYKADLRAVFTVAETVAQHLDHDLVFVNKSTVPVGTGEKCEEKIQAILKKRGLTINIPVVSNPEFLREGMAVTDTMMPDRVVVGVNGGAISDQRSAISIMEDLYRPITRVGKPLVFMSRESAEIVKYASNAFLATKISFINMLTPLCEKTGANIRDIAKGVGLDNRIGPKFLHAGIGYGGSCFPKDVKALLAISREWNIPLPIVEATDAVNHQQRKRFIDRILQSLKKKSLVAVLGLAFKPKTDDMREAPAIDVIEALINAGHSVTAFDPVAMDRAKPLLPKGVKYSSSPLEVAKGADAVLVLTEWDVFRGLDLKALKKMMKGKNLFDGRNIYEPEEAETAGLKYVGIGLT